MKTKERIAMRGKWVFFLFHRSIMVYNTISEEANPRLSSLSLCVRVSLRLVKDFDYNIGKNTK